MVYYRRRHVLDRIGDVEQGRGSPSKTQNESRIEEYQPGFAEISAFNSFDKKGGLYRRFRRTSARNILYLQSEIATLTDMLEHLDREDVRLTDDIAKKKAQEYAKDWDALERLADEHDHRANERLGLVHDLRSLIKQYCM